MSRADRRAFSFMPKSETTTLSSQVTAEGGFSPEAESAVAASIQAAPCEIAATLGGQAVLEGIMMRSKNTLAIAVRYALEPAKLATAVASQRPCR